MFRALFLAALLSLCLVSEASAASGMASYYSGGGLTACGERFNRNAMTAAHPSYPCGSRVAVTNLRNGKTVILTINDRGPFVRGRIIDVSYMAASYLGMVGSGTAPVNVELLSAGKKAPVKPWSKSAAKSPKKKAKKKHHSDSGSLSMLWFGN